MNFSIVSAVSSTDSPPPFSPRGVQIKASRDRSLWKSTARAVRVRFSRFRSSRRLTGTNPRRITNHIFLLYCCDVVRPCLWSILWTIRVNMEQRWNDADRGEQEGPEKNLAATSSTTNPTWTALGANPCLRGQTSLWWKELAVSHHINALLAPFLSDLLFPQQLYEFPVEWADVFQTITGTWNTRLFSFFLSKMFVDVLADPARNGHFIISFDSMYTGKSLHIFSLLLRAWVIQRDPLCMQTLGITAWVIG